jgi:hypothetical protein
MVTKHNVLLVNQGGGVSGGVSGGDRFGGFAEWIGIKYVKSWKNIAIERGKGNKEETMVSWERQKIKSSDRF